MFLLVAEMPQALYVNMSELATLAATRAQQQHGADHPQQEKVRYYYSMDIIYPEFIIAIVI